MSLHTLIISPSATRTRVLLTQGPDELMRANLPPPSCVHYERAVTTFLEGLSMWLDHKIQVVLSVDAQDASFCLGLTDELGIGHQRVFFDVSISLRNTRNRGRGAAKSSTVKAKDPGKARGRRRATARDRVHKADHSPTMAMAKWRRTCGALTAKRPTSCRS